jgi:antibiotic biosynthesis monooxygenase (ABM) superfamily enzyme
MGQSKWLIANQKKETWKAPHLINAKNYFVVGSLGWVMPPHPRALPDTKLVVCGKLFCVRVIVSIPDVWP